MLVKCGAAPATAEALDINATRIANGELVFYASAEGSSCSYMVPG